MSREEQWLCSVSASYRTVSGADSRLGSKQHSRKAARQPVTRQAYEAFRAAGQQAKQQARKAASKRVSHKAAIRTAGF